jgi:hypothetical protein
VEFVLEAAESYERGNWVRRKKMIKGDQNELKTEWDCAAAVGAAGAQKRERWVSEWGSLRRIMR